MKTNKENKMEPKFFEVTVEDVNILRQMFGDKTINQIRQEAGLLDVTGGDAVYVDFIAQHSEVKKPTLKLISNPFRE
jgi:hypothetical protein